MDSRPLGVFDSGIGGLTVLKQIHSLLPNESTIYIGDNARVPYGNRSPATIIHFSQQIINALIKFQVKAVIAACSTASAVALPHLRHHYQLPLIDVILPTTAYAIGKNKGKPIGVIGTRATINSHTFRHALHHRDPQTSVTEIACPLLVPLIEEGITSGPLIDHTLDLYLTPLKNYRPGTVILGCTHYPVIFKPIKSFLGPATDLIDPGIPTAKQVAHLLSHQQLRAASGHRPVHRFFTTDDPQTFSRHASDFLSRPVTRVDHLELDI